MQIAVKLLGYLLCAAGIVMPQLGRAQSGQQIFSSICAGCHGLDGRGGEHAPNIVSGAPARQRSDAELFRIVHDGIPASGMPGFGGTLDRKALNSVIAYVRVLQGKGTEAETPGDANKGRALFFGSAHCAQCHMMHGKGGFIAADLSEYGASHSPAEIRAAILDPDRDLDPRDRIVVVVLRDGRKYTGMARNEDNFSLQLQTLDGAFHFFDKSEVRKVEHLPRSLMPSNYGARLSGEEVDDLVSYLAGAR